MQWLSSVATKASRDGELLDKVSDAMLCLRAEETGVTEQLGYSPQDVEASRRSLMEFLQSLVEQLCSPELEQEEMVRRLVNEMLEAGKSREDWIEDIEGVIGQLSQAAPLVEEDWKSISILSRLLDNEFTKSLKMLKGW